MIAGQNSKSAGIHRERFVHAEFGGEISHGTGSQHSRVARAPSPLRIFVLAEAAIGVVDPAVEDEFRCAGLEFGERILVEQRDGTVIELTPAQRIEIAEQAGRIVIPAPPQVASERPEPLLGRRDETIEGAGFAHHGRNPVRSLREQTNLSFREDPRLQGLNHQNTLQHTSINEGNSEERLIIILAGFAEILKARMIFYVFNGHRADLFRDQAGESFIDGHAKLADALGAKPERRCQHEIGAVGLKQVGGANIGTKPSGNQGNHVHQGLGRLAGLRRQVRNFVPRQHVTGVERAGSMVLVLHRLVRLVQSCLHLLRFLGSSNRYNQ